MTLALVGAVSSPRWASARWHTLSTPASPGHSGRFSTLTIQVLGLRPVGASVRPFASMWRVIFPRAPESALLRWGWGRRRAARTRSASSAARLSRSPISASFTVAYPSGSRAASCVLLALEA